MMTSEQDIKVKEHMVLHLEELMEDTDVYGSDKVQAFHAAWLKQLEQNRCTWSDMEQKFKMRSLIWHATMTSKVPSASSSTGSGKAISSLRVYNAQQSLSPRLVKCLIPANALKGMSTQSGNIFALSAWLTSTWHFPILRIHATARRGPNQMLPNGSGTHAILSSL